jgi:hypothetical protein
VVGLEEGDDVVGLAVGDAVGNGARAGAGAGAVGGSRWELVGGERLE